MQSTDQPELIPIPFAASGGRSVIPSTSQIGIVDGAASWPDGFPPLTRTPPASGGKPPSGLDMNGVLYTLSANLQWWLAGGNPKRNSAFQATVGGYPTGSMLQSSDNVGWWRSTADNNTTDPEGGSPANWDPVQGYGVLALTMSSSNVTVTPLQALRRQIVLTGTLGANVNLVLPTNRQEWLILNKTSGAFTITAKTASGSGVALLAGPNVVCGDGANILHEQAMASLLNTNGYRITPDGLIEQWGTYSPTISGDLSTASVSFPTQFKSACYNVSLTLMNLAADGVADAWLSLAASPTTSGFSVRIEYTGSGGVARVNGFMWRAIGR